MIDAKHFSEIYSILTSLGDEFTNKLPDEVLSFIANERDVRYNPIIDEDKSNHEQGFDKTTMTFITMLKLDYWCESNEERDKLLRELDENEAVIKNELNSATSTRQLMKMLRDNKV